MIRKYFSEKRTAKLCISDLVFVLLYHVKSQSLKENDKEQNGKGLNAISRNYIYQMILRYVNERNISSESESDNNGTKKKSNTYE